MSNDRLMVLEGLRGVLSWWVVIGHSLIEAGFDAAWLPGMAKVLVCPGYAVDVFVILSGFVISHSLSTRPKGYPQFIIARFFRLYPLFAVSVCCGFLMFGNVYLTYRSFQVLAPSPAWIPEVWASHENNLSLHLLASLTMLHGAVPNSLLPYAYNPFVSPAWSVSLEWQFYLIAPVLIAGLHYRPGWTSLLAVLAVGFRGFYNVGGWGSFLPQHFEFFALGMASYAIYARLAELRLDTRSGLGLSGGMLVLLLLICEPMRAMLVNPWNAHLGEWLPLCIWIFVLALVVELRAGGGAFAKGTASLLLNPLAQYLGRVSYSTYLVHYFAIFLAMALGVMFETPLSKYQAAGLLLGVAVPVTLVLSFVSYRWIELPGIRAGRSVASWAEGAFRRST